MIKSSFLILSSLLFTLLSSVCVAENNLWQQLEVSGSSLDIMGMEARDDQVSLVGAKYVESHLQGVEESNPDAIVPPIVRKHLYVMRIDRNERVLWQRDYPALPDAQEVFSISKSDNHRLCIVYGEPQVNKQSLNPVLLQLNKAGKIVWATREAVTKYILSPDQETGLEQIANLDTLLVAATPDNGCLLTFVTRFLSRDEESFRLHFIAFSNDGSESWRKSIPTQYYGKMFLVYNQEAGQYVIVQTNQSRDAAIQAMMLAMPFRPETMITGINQQGKILYQYDKLPGLEKIWIKAVSKSEGTPVLLSGKSTTAWAAYFKPEGELLDVNNKLEGEFDAATSTDKGGYAFIRGEYLTTTDKNLANILNQKVSSVTDKEYINRYLSARLPEDLPAQQILQLEDDNYLVLFKLGSKLLKLHATKNK